MELPGEILRAPGCENTGLKASPSPQGSCVVANTVSVHAHRSTRRWEKKWCIPTSPRHVLETLSNIQYQASHSQASHLSITPTCPIQLLHSCRSTVAIAILHAVSNPTTIRYMDLFVTSNLEPHILRDTHIIYLYMHRNGGLHSHLANCVASTSPPPRTTLH